MFNTTWRYSKIGIFNVQVTLNSSLILVLFQSLPTKIRILSGLEVGILRKFCWPFWKMAAIEVKGQICNGPIAKNFL